MPPVGAPRSDLRRPGARMAVPGLEMVGQLLLTPGRVKVARVSMIAVSFRLFFSRYGPIVTSRPGGPLRFTPGRGPFLLSPNHLPAPQ
eukprot:312994-Hanusia_phi.AAC.1